MYWKTVGKLVGATQGNANVPSGSTAAFVPLSTLGSASCMGTSSCVLVSTSAVGGAVGAGEVAVIASSAIVQADEVARGCPLVSDFSVIKVSPNYESLSSQQTQEKVHFLLGLRGANPWNRRGT